MCYITDRFFKPITRISTRDKVVYKVATQDVRDGHFYFFGEEYEPHFGVYIGSGKIKHERGKCRSMRHIFKDGVRCITKERAKSMRLRKDQYGIEFLYRCVMPKGTKYIRVGYNIYASRIQLDKPIGQQKI